MSIKKTTLHPDGDFSVDLYPKTSYDQVDGIYNVYTTGPDQAIEYRFIPDTQRVETYINVDAQIWSEIISNSFIEFDGDVAINWGRLQNYNYLHIANNDTQEVVTIKSNGVISYKEERNLYEVPIYDIQLKQKYRLIRDITLEENVEQIDITTDSNGNQLKLKSVFIRFMGMFTATASVQSFVLRFNGGNWYQMYDFYNVTADRLYVHWIKSDRLNTPTTDMWLSAYPFQLCMSPSGELVNSQGLADMCRTVHSDIAWYDGGNRTINRIGYGCASVGGANIKAGSRIVIWGIDDNE